MQDSTILWTMCETQQTKGISVETIMQILWNPFYWPGLSLVTTWVSDYIHYKAWSEITYPFPNFNGATV